MNKTKFFALLMLCVFLLSGCSLVMKDSTVDGLQTIIDVNGEKINKRTYVAHYNNEYNNYYYLYSMYGVSTDSLPAMVQSHVFEELEKQTVLMQQAKAQGLDALTEEETAKAEENAHTAYDNYLSSLKDAYFASSTLEGDALDEAIKAYAEKQGVQYDSYLQSAKDELILEKLENTVKSTVVMTDDDIQNALNTLIEAEKASYESSLAAFGNSFNAGTKTYYTPAGYRMVSVVEASALTLPAATEESAAEQPAAKEVATEEPAVEQPAAEETATEETTAAEEPAAEEAATEEAAAEQPAVEEAATAEPAAEQPAVEEAAAEQPAVEEAVTEETAAEQPTAEEAATEETAAEEPAAEEAAAEETTEAATDAVDYSAQIAYALQLLQEEGHTSDQIQQYALCAESTNLPAAVVEAAMQLSADHPLSEAIEADGKVYLVRFDMEMAEHESTLEEVRDTLADSTLSDMQEDAYNAQVEAWMSEATIYTYPERLADD